MHLYLKIALCSLLALLLASCGSESESSNDENYTDIHALPEISAELLLTIADSDELMFNFISDVAPTNDGHLLVLDSRSSKAYLFSGDGSLLGTGIGEGRGPGESQFTASRLSINQDDEFIIHSQVLRRFSIYDLEDSRIRPIVEISTDRFPSEFALLPDGTILLYERKETRPDGRDYERFSIMSRDGEILRDEFLTLPPAETVVVRHPNGSIMMSISTQHHPANMIAVHDDLLLVANQTVAGFDMYQISTGELEREVRFNLPDMPVSEEEKRELLTGYTAVMDISTSQYNEMLAGIPDTRGKVSGLKYDPAGYVWLRITPEPGEPEDTQRWIVLNESGELTGRWEPANGARLLRVQDGRLYTVASDENDLQEIEIMQTSLGNYPS